MQHSPSVPEIVRVDTSSLDSAIAHLVSELTPGGGGFNYLDATKRIRKAHKGLHDIRRLTAAAPSVAKRTGHEYNMDVVRLAAPLAFGRKVSVIDLSPRKLPYAGGRLASYRVPFFILENRIVKAYFLQPRKNTRFTLRQLGLLSTIIRENLLESEFYGEQVDVEIVDVSCVESGEDRIVRRYCLADLPEWSPSEMKGHFDIVAQALRVIEEEQLVTKVRRPLRDKELPLFD